MKMTKEKPDDEKIVSLVLAPIIVVPLFSAIFSLILCIFFNLEQPIFVFWDFFTKKTVKNPGTQKVNTCFCP